MNDKIFASSAEKIEGKVIIDRQDLRFNTKTLTWRFSAQTHS